MTASFFFFAARYGAAHSIGAAFVAAQTEPTRALDCALQEG